jgi:hypothetical protein
MIKNLVLQGVNGNMIEEWKIIEGYNNYYKISNFGNIKNKYNKILKCFINKNGYKYVMLYNNKKRRNVLVHRLVAETYISKIDIKMTVNHIDGKKSNNNKNNLEIVSSSENQKHAYKNGLRKENKNTRQIVRSDNKIFKNAYDASKELNVSVCSVRDVLKGRIKTCKGYKFKYI